MIGTPRRFMSWNLSSRALRSKRGMALLSSRVLDLGQGGDCGFGSAEGAWHLYANQAGFDAGPLANRWLPLLTFGVSNSLAMMATGMYGNEGLRSMRFATARLLAAISLDRKSTRLNSSH